MVARYTGSMCPGPPGVTAPVILAVAEMAVGMAVVAGAVIEVAGTDRWPSGPLGRPAHSPKSTTVGGRGDPSSTPIRD
jgi:hypothetical protein